MDELHGRQKMEISFAVAMAASAFMPILKVPILGTVTPIGANGGFLGAVAIVLAIAIIVGAFKNSPWIPKAGAGVFLLVAALSFAAFAWKVRQVGIEIERDIRDNPFKGQGKELSDAMSLSWGWVVMFLSPIGCLLAAEVAQRVLGESEGADHYRERGKPGSGR